MRPGDIVRTSTGRVRRLAAVKTSGSARYVLMPLPGGSGRRSYASEVDLVRSAELDMAYTYIRQGVRRQEAPGGASAVTSFARAALHIQDARERGADGPGELIAAARTLNDARTGLAISTLLEV